MDISDCKQASNLYSVSLPTIVVLPQTRKLTCVVPDFEVKIYKWPYNELVYHEVF